MWRIHGYDMKSVLAICNSNNSDTCLNFDKPAEQDIFAKDGDKFPLNFTDVVVELLPIQRVDSETTLDLGKDPEGLARCIPELCEREADDGAVEVPFRGLGSLRLEHCEEVGRPTPLLLLLGRHGRPLRDGIRGPDFTDGMKTQ